MKNLKRITIASLLMSGFCLLVTPLAHAKPAFCDLDGYRPFSGLTAVNQSDGLIVTWSGEQDQENRIRLRIVSGVPTIAELSVRHRGGNWNLLAGNLTPEYRVISGYRRLDQEAYPALKASVGDVTQQVLDHYKWDAFWDAPLRVPGDEIAHGNSTPPPNGIPGTDQPGLPRKPEEIRRVTATYHATECEAKSNGKRLEISFPGVEMGIFSGRLQYTIFEGTNLLRQELIAKTEEQSVAYKYDAGLDGVEIHPGSRLVWRDTANNWQDYRLGAPLNGHPSTVRAANRLLAFESPTGSIATFPPPHNFFWTREISVNLGYNWYRKDNDSCLSFGIRQAESEEDPAYAGRGPEDRRQNFALYNARPGTWQRMPVYFLIEAGNGSSAIRNALAYTRNDHYAAIPGYWVMARHFHTNPIPRLLGSGGIDNVLPDFELARATGVNVFGPVGAGGIVPSGNIRIGPRQNPPAAGAAPRPPEFNMPDDVRLKMQSLYYEMARVQSRKDFLVMPNEELFTGPLGGHNDVLISHPVYWTNKRDAGQPFVEELPKYGKVYHIGSPADLMEMTHREDMLIFMPHPDTKGSAGYPGAFKDADFFRDPNYRGIGFRWGMGVDRSEQRLSDYRCMPLFDEMNNWVADEPTPPKYMDAITETYEQGPGDDFYANNPVSYIKLDGSPTIDNWKPIIDAMMAGHFFVTSGEILIPSYSVTGTGNRRLISADVEWTFPLEFAEVVWGDGTKTDRQIISVTDQPAFGKHRFEIPFDAQGKKWVRFAVWDSAGNGAFVQPTKLNGSGSGPVSARLR